MVLTDSHASWPAPGLNDAPDTNLPDGAAERQKAVEERVRKLAKANEALQAIIDVLRESGDLDQLAARVLQIAAQALDSEACALYDNEPSGLIRLKYYCLQGRIFAAGQLDHLENPAVVPMLEAGFTVPDSYLGGDAQKVLGPVVLDHRSGTSVPEFDRFAVANGWDWELNIGVAANGLRAFTFCVYRGHEWPFGEAEIVLADSLAKQLGLAVETRRSAAKARETTLAREREKAAEERVRELAKVNETLRRGLDRFADFDCLESYATSLIQEAAEVFSADSATVMVREGKTTAFSPVAVVTDGYVWSPEEIAADPFLGTYTEVSGRDPGGILSRLIEQPLASETILDEELAKVWPTAYEYHQRRYGHRISWQFPLRLRGRVLGFFAFALRRPDSPTPTQVESVAALAQQFTLALEMTRLADKAREMALAREREQAAQERATELAKVNRSLRESVHVVAHSADFDQSLAEVVLRISATAEAQMGALFVYDEAINTLCCEFWFENGVLHWELDPQGPPCMRGPFDADVSSAFHHYVAQQQIMYVNLEEIDEATRAAAWPEVLDWHLANGRRATCAIPVFASRPLGIIGLAWTDQTIFGPEQLEMLTALSNQAALVMQLRHMERAARAATIAREQEQAAQERAAELAKANDALKRTLDVVAFEPNLNQVLGHVLASITQQLGSPSSALWLWEQASGQFRTHLVFHEGRVLELTDENRKRLQGVWGRGRGLLWNDHIRERKPVVYQVADLEGAEQRDFFQGLGIHSLLGIPLLLGSEIVGSITVRFDTARVFQPQELELAQALAHQATMAVQLTRLAERAGEAALNEERARFAREIHDTLAQGFTGILMQLGAISQVKGDQRSAIQSQLNAMTALAQASLAEARRSVRAFRPASGASDVRLDRAVEQFVEKVRLQTEAAVTLQVEGTPPRLSERVESELSGIVQEALNNAVKHARAKHIYVSLYFEGQPGVSISVEDDGVGFDSSAQTGTDCFGLIGMRERATSIGASLTVISEEGRGTEIVLQYKAP